MADPIITPAFVDPIVKEGVSKLVDVITHAWSYRTYVTSLRSDHLQLQTRLSDVQRDVTDARSSGLDIRLSVEKWLQEGNSKLGESDNFLESLHPTFSKCWKFTCDCNCKRRYDTATKAETLSKEIKTLLERYPNESVSFEPRPPPLAPSLAADYFAMTSRENFLKRLKDSLSEKFVIGVYGQKGAGKTMLVKKLAVDIESEPEPGGQFKSVVLTSSKDYAKDIQQGIVERILGRPLNLQTPQERARSLHDRLVKIGKVVFIIDDVDRKIDLQNEIGIPWPDANNGCRQDCGGVKEFKCVRERMKTQTNLEVGPLSQDESLDLFDELVKEYDFGSTRLHDARDHISSSKQAWFPGEIEAYIGDLHSKTLLPTKSVVAPGQSRDKKFMLVADELQIEHGDKPQH